MKKILSLLLIFLLAITVFGCGQKDKVKEVTWQSKTIEDMPEYMQDYLKDLQKDSNCKALDFSGDILVFASMGEQNTGGYEIKIEKAEIKEGKLYVEVTTTAPKKEDDVTQAITYPYVLAQISEENLPEDVVFEVKGDLDLGVQETKVEIIPEQEKSIVSLYFGNEDGYLRKESREINGLPTPERGKEIIEELIAGTKSEDDTKNVLPKGTKVLNYDFDEEKGLVTIDFSEHLHAVQGSQGEALAVYGIVNTLTDLPGVENVQILIEGKKVESLAGHVFTEEPLKRDMSLFEGNEFK